MSVLSQEQHQLENISSSTESMLPLITEEEVSSKVEQQPSLSVYDLHSKSKKKFILVIVSFVQLLYTLADTAHLPSIPKMIEDLHTTQMLGELTIGLYLLTASFSSLFWGVLLDRYGRKTITLIGLLIFCFLSIGCAYSYNITSFLIFRALQGCSVSMTLLVGQSTIADIYKSEERGLATGMSYTFIYCGPIIGPIIGGLLADLFGWRSVFVFLAMYSGIFLIIYLTTIPETQQYFAIQIYLENKSNVKITENADQITIGRPKLSKPWLPLLYLIDPSVTPYIFALSFSFASMLITLINYSKYSFAKPYEYSERTIGLLYIPTGVAFFIGSTVGGKLTDFAASRKYSVNQISIIEARMVVPAVCFSMLMPIGLLIYGWSFQYISRIFLPIFGQMLVGLSHSGMRPGILSHLTIKYQQQAASIVSANTFLQGLLAGIGITLTSYMISVLNIGPAFTVLALINLVITIITSLLVCKKIVLMLSSSESCDKNRIEEGPEEQQLQPLLRKEGVR